MEKKPRLLYLLKLMLEHTDEEHPLSTNQIIDYMHAHYDIDVYRTTVAKDMASLSAFGIDIVTVRSSQTLYFVGNRPFELAELKILIDAVESSKLITAKKTETLTRKIHALINEEQAHKLKRNSVFAERVKPTNEYIYYIVDAINEAINTKQQIAFWYYEYTPAKEKVLRNGGEVYVISPYHLIWCGDFYYVLGYSDKREHIVTFRVDRIAATPEILPEAAMPMPADFDVSEYIKQVFYMYDGEQLEVSLRCDNSLMKIMIDRFGEEVQTAIYDDHSFRLTAAVAASPTFYGWVFGFGGLVQILAPAKVLAAYKQMVREASAALDG